MSKLLTPASIPYLIFIIVLPTMVILYLSTDESFDKHKYLVKAKRKLLPWLIDEEGAEEMLEQFFGEDEETNENLDTFDWMCRVKPNELKEPTSNERRKRDTETSGTPLPLSVCDYDSQTVRLIPPPADLEPKPFHEIVQLHMEQARTNNYELLKDGTFKPKNCIPTSTNAIIVCYRERERHLKWFLEHTISTLMFQKSEFKIYVVEPLPDTIFNRAKLFNVGFAEAIKDKGEGYYNCVTFHDFDLIWVWRDGKKIFKKKIFVS